VLKRIIREFKYVFCIYKNISMNLEMLWKVLWVLWTYGDKVWLLLAVAVQKCGWNCAWALVVTISQFFLYCQVKILWTKCYNTRFVEQYTFMKDHIRPIFLSFDIPAWFTYLNTWTIRYPEHKEFITNIKWHHSYS